MNATDIRILKPIGVIEEAAAGMQLELNIVSIKGGELQYDLRPWSLDHDKVGQGVSFTAEGSKALLALLKECFKDGGEGIDLTTIHIPDINLFGDPIPEPPKVDTTICDILTEKGIEFIDKRANGGALWITGGHELDSVMVEIAEKGFKFAFSEKGGKQTKGQPGWYIRAPKK